MSNPFTVEPQEFLEALGSYYYDKQSILSDEEFEKLREVSGW